MEGRGSLDAALNSVRMQNSGCSGDAVLGSSRLMHGSQLIDGDAALAPCLWTLDKAQTQAILSL